MIINKSLFGRVMTVAALASVAIIVGAGVVAYSVTYSEVTEYRMGRLSESTNARAQRQEATFEQIEASLVQSLEAYHRTRDTMTAERALPSFVEAFPPFGDGSRRSTDPMFEGTVDGRGRNIFGIGALIPSSTVLEEERILHFMSGYEVVTTFGPSLRGQLANFWFFANTGDIVVFAPERADELRPYRYDLPPDFDFSGHIVSKIGSVENNPSRGTVCGSLNGMVYDPNGQRTDLTSSCQIPVDDENGNHIGSIGTTLPITGWMNETIQTENNSDYRYMLVSEEDGLLTHRDLGTVGKAADVERLAKAERVDRILSMIDGPSGAYTDSITGSTIAYANIAGANWFLVAVQPKSVIASAARDAALLAASATGMTALLLLCVIGWFVISLIARPLRALADEADKPITEAGGLKDLALRDDEIGRLGGALIQRDQRVNSLVETLEQRVIERTNEIEVARQDAEAANEAKTAFLATMSHEIRTPMNGVVGMAEALARTNLDSEQRDYLGVMTRSGESLLALIDDILDISKIEAGKLKIEPMPVSPRDIIDEVCGLYSEAAAKKGLTLSSDISGIAMEHIGTDALRLRQILSNLVSNAIKFTEVGQVTVTARELGKGILEIAVTDTGRGIPAKLQATIFNKFEQAEKSTTRRFGGTGLGLAISRELAHLLGGDLTVSSIPHAGATFTLTIRSLDTTGASDTPEPTRLEVPEMNAERMSELSLLVAEDLEVNRRVLEAICKPLGIKLTMAENGQEALELIAGDTFDAVLMDLRMPVMDGLEATRRIRAGEAGELAKRTPIIALTANAMREHVVESLDAGADAHVAKPISRSALIAALTEHCGLEADAAPEARQA
ncbi:MAG: ATP-binding protein [Pseudomonadota bacterium]